ncbi:MAG: hypothetical protein KAT49_00490 [Methanomicrobia archaeon]|jgi:hypothetical protein|nr:hypothetical protein [Methanomicrobia archaeon]
MEKKESIFEYGKREVPKKKKDMYETVKSESAVSPLFWIVLAIFVVLVLLNLFWDYIKGIGPSIFVSAGIFILFIIINIFSAIKRKKK